MNENDIKENDIKEQLREQSKEREQLLSGVLKDIANYSEQIAKQEESFQQLKIDEIKYKTTIKEQNGYIKIYKQKLEHEQIENDKLNKEVTTLRKKVLTQTTKLSSLQSILDLFIREYGIKQISDITKIEEEQLNKLIEKIN